MKTGYIYIVLITVSLSFIQCNSEKIDTKLSFVSFEYAVPTKSSLFPQEYPILAKFKYIINVFNATTDTLEVKDMAFYEMVNNKCELIKIDTAFKRLEIPPSDSLWIGVYSNKINKIANSSIDYKSFLDSIYHTNLKYTNLLFKFKNKSTRIVIRENVRIHHDLIDPYNNKFLNTPSVFWLGMKDARLDTNAMYYINLKKHIDRVSKMLNTK